MFSDRVMNSKNDVNSEGNQDPKEVCQNSSSSTISTKSNSNTEVKISKNAAKKKLRWEKIKECRRESRRKKKESKKLKPKKSKDDSILPDKVTTDIDSLPLSKKQLKQIERKRLLSVLDRDKTGCADRLTYRPLQVCIDCQFGEKMSDKELSHLASQIRRIYGSNKSNEHPASLTLVGLDEKGKTFKTMCEKNDGFQNYIVHRTSKSINDEYSTMIDKLVYLTPDSSYALEDLDDETVYVIGGFVDDTVKKQTTLEFADKHKIVTARLPIKEYCLKDENNKGTFKEILTVNQVFDILQKFYECKDWSIALSNNIPQRVGYKINKSA